MNGTPVGSTSDTAMKTMTTTQIAIPEIVIRGGHHPHVVHRVVPPRSPSPVIGVGRA